MTLCAAYLVDPFAGDTRDIHEARGLDQGCDTSLCYVMVPGVPVSGRSSGRAICGLRVASKARPGHLL